MVEGDCWLRRADAVDLRVLDRCNGPVLDVGCGPGRHTVALAERGISALGVDVTDAMLEVARPRGAPVLRRSIFDPLPGTGRWGTALVLDANLGIGGDLGALLQRLHELLCPDGLLLAEPVAGVGSTHGPARVELEGTIGPWFPWVGVDGAALLREVGGGDRFRLVERWTDEGRTFVALRRSSRP